MIKENLIILRNIHGFSQETVAEKVGVSRQAYAKWEKGDSLPNIDKCNKIAKLYDTTIDALLQTQKSEEIGTIPPAPKSKNIWGTVTVNNRGQVVIPKGVRDKFKLTNGKGVVVLSDDDGIVLLPKEKFAEKMSEVMKYASIKK